MIRAIMLAAALAPAALADSPRVALVYSDFDNYRHRDDYDAALERLGWPVEEYENVHFAQLVERLGSTDIVLCGALYNYGAPQDLSGFAVPLRRFLAQGGAIVITDANYDSHVDWLASLRPDLTAEIEACQAQAGSLTIPNPGHPLLNYPHKWRPRPMWSHLKLGPGWDVLASDADGGSVLAVAGEGRGAVWLSSNWSLPGQCLEGIWEWLQTRRLGLDVREIHGFGELRPGDSHARMAVASLDGSPVRASVTWAAGPEAGRRVQRRRHVEIPQDGLVDVDLHMPVRWRGRGTSWFTIEASGITYESPHVEHVVPPLVTVDLARPAYRGVLLLSEPDPSVVVRATVYPGWEDLKGATLAATLHDSEQARRTVTAELPNEYGASTELLLPAHGLAAGPCRVELAASRPREELWTGEAALHASEDREGVALAGALDTYVDGVPFFPIGIYHVPLESLAEARAMGFNCLQLWGDSPEQALANLDAAHEVGLKVILEMSGLVRGGLQPEALRAVVGVVREHPALLCWYPVDEPNGEMAGECEQAYRICRELDDSHPVYLVLCDPNLFAAYSEALDVLGIDPYPVPGASVSMVAGWMAAAQEATDERRAVWLIPQLHNIAAYGGDPSQGRAPTAEEQWCMVFQGLIYGAKGIVYYPWDDGVCGLIHEPELMAELPRINAFLAEHGASLAASPRVLLSGLGGLQESPDVHAARFEGHTDILLVTNTAAEPRRLTLELPWTEARSLTDDAVWHLQGGRLELDLRPLEVVAIEAR